MATVTPTTSRMRNSPRTTSSSVASSPCCALLLMIATMLVLGGSDAFAPPLSAPVPLQRLQQQYRTATTTTVTALRMAAVAIPNPLKKLPWNVKKEQERANYRRKLERSRLHRQLGIPEDATYEEIVAATDRLVAAADGNLKEKVQINERLAGLQSTSQEARAMSSYELEGCVFRF
jgi:hypothetical protein